MIRISLLLLFIPALCFSATEKEDDPRFQYYSCVKSESIKYSKSNEPAEIAATAAIESCSMQESKAVNAAGPGLSPIQQKKVRDLFREQTKPFAIKIIMDERMKKAG